jgi:chaperone required for assembly of F1-ATPase
MKEVTNWVGVEEPWNLRLLESLSCLTGSVHVGVAMIMWKETRVKRALSYA